MKPRFEIVEARAWHVGQMTRRLRVEHMRALAVLGADTHRELRARYEESTYCKSWLMDGRLVGLGGVTGPLISPVGFVWLALTFDVLKYPLEIAREARLQIEIASRFKQRLYNSVLAEDQTAQRFAVSLGITPSGASMNRAADGEGRRNVMARLTSDPEHRIPYGGSYALSLQYDCEAA